MLRGSAVREALDLHGDSVFAVVATAGSTNFGIVDDIASIAEVTRERGVWLHVDGAYGLAAMLSPVARHRLAGVEQADSLVVDPHKWLFAPFDACALIYRDPELGRRAHTQHAEYLDTLTETNDWSPSDYAVHLTRRPRGLPLWFSLATYGAAAYRAAITQTLELAQDIHSCRRSSSSATAGARPSTPNGRGHSSTNSTRSSRRAATAGAPTPASRFSTPAPRASTSRRSSTRCSRRSGCLSGALNWRGAPRKGLVSPAARPFRAPRGSMSAPRRCSRRSPTRCRRSRAG
jgi:hypothetical protein